MAIQDRLVMKLRPSARSRSMVFHPQMGIPERTAFRVKAAVAAEGVRAAPRVAAPVAVQGGWAAAAVRPAALAWAAEPQSASLFGTAMSRSTHVRSPQAPVVP